MSNGTSASRTAAIGGAAGGAVSAIIWLLIMLARADPTIDNDYICVCDEASGGDPATAQAHIVDGPIGTCLHPNPKNNFWCRLPQ